MSKVAAYAAYLPPHILTKQAAQEAWPGLIMANGSRSVRAFDEDVITMSVHAALLAMEKAGVTGSQLSGVFLATSSGPYSYKSNAALVADYLNVPSAARLMDAGLGSHAGLNALIAALREDELTKSGPILVVAGDDLVGRPGDPTDVAFGAAAVAFVVSAEGFASLEKQGQRYSSQSTIWRVPGETQLRRYDDDRLERHAGFPAQMRAGLKDFVGGLEQAPSLYALQLGNGGDAGIASAAGGSADQVVGADRIKQNADTGCANALLNLTLAFDKAAAGDTIAVQAFGTGAGTVSALLKMESEGVAHGASELRDDARSEVSYVEFSKRQGVYPMPGVPSMGAPFVASPMQERDKHETIGLTAGRCKTCGSLNFPPRDYCLDCRGQEFEPEQLPRLAKVATYNIQYIVAIGPEETPMPICTAVLDGEREDTYGGKVAALICEIEPDDVKIGLGVELVPRRGDVEDGLVQYGWKFRPRKGA